MPFIIINIKKFNFSLKAIRINDYIFYSIFILIFFLLLQNFYYDETMKGGGIFYKISVKIFNTYYFFYIISFISFLFIYLVFLEKNFKDILLIIIIVCLDPDPFVYNKTFDPLWFCLILILVESKFFKIFTSGEKIFENLKIIFGFQFIYITIYFTTRYLFAL